MCHEGFSILFKDSEIKEYNYQYKYLVNDKQPRFNLNSSSSTLVLGIRNKMIKSVSKHPYHIQNNCNIYIFKENFRTF